MRVLLWTVTLLRVALLPPFVLLASRAQSLPAAGAEAAELRWTVAALLVVIGLSDVVDGWIARRFDLTTQAGAIVDAAADKLVQVVLVTFFTFSSGAAYWTMPLWFLAILVGRDLLLGGGLAFATVRSVKLHVVHEGHGRASSALVFAILGWITFGLPRAALMPAVVVTALIIVVSSTSYFLTGCRQAAVILRERGEGVFG